MDGSPGVMRVPDKAADKIIRDTVVSWQLDL